MSNPIKKTMVYLGLADEELDTESPAGPVQARPHAPVTPLRRAAAVAPVAEMNQIMTVHPRQYRDAQGIAEAFREGMPVIINLSEMSDGDARRLIDFASGLSQGLLGKIERVTNKVFLLSPAHVLVAGEAVDSEADIEASFFAQQ